MYYVRELLESYSPRLRTLLYKQDQIDSLDKKAAELEPVLYKIIQTSREEKEVFVYMRVMIDAMYYFILTDPVKALRCARLFFRDAKRLMEEGLAAEKYPAAVMGKYMTVVSYIAEIYGGFYQISHERMEELFKIYKENTSTYGEEWRFYEAKLHWEILSRNREGAAFACRCFLSFTIPSGVCYICMNEVVTEYFVFMDDFDSAMEQCRNFISGNIPKEYNERYETCEVANSYMQYYKLCRMSLENEKRELLERGLPFLYEAIQASDEDEEIDSYISLVFALYDDFSWYQNHVTEAASEIDGKKKHTPYDYMYVCLNWMTYFIRLSHSGVKTVAFSTEELLPLLADEAGQYRVPELASYFERIADEIGAKFEESRRGFSYGKRKEFFRGLADSPGRLLFARM